MNNGLIMGLLQDIFPWHHQPICWWYHILLLNSYEENARYLKLSLAYLEQLPWMKINYDKSDLMIIGLDDNLANDLASPFL